jgi:molybdenum cofactor synthesis domain-containing protein
LGCTVEIVSIGNELLLGNTANTNASWIASHVTKLGGKVTRVTTVPDDLGEISRTLRESVGRKPSLIITTGGIGPTFDDMTLRGVARAFRVRMKLNTLAGQMIRAHYNRRFPDRRIILTKPRLKMALMPATGTPIRNPVGTAPAVRLRVLGTDIFCLPGVPREAKSIFRDTISNVVSSKSNGRVFVERWLEVHGVMESALSPLIDRVMRRWPGVYVKSHPRGVEAGGRPFIELHFSTSSANPLRAKRLVKDAVHMVREELRKKNG